MEKRKSIIWNFIKSVIINSLIVLAFSGLFSNSLRIEKTIYGFYGALLITLFYMFIRPLLMLVSIIPIVMTFGIFIVIINAFLIALVSYLLAPRFEVASFGAAFFLAIFISLFNALLNSNDRKIIIKRF
ncbi:phage holin family protein [Gemella cuniculi]|uniref:phage holin family protein n=1 Tax=Gemella cuniculi TaxID=150240 RepID=UPI00041EA92C|nr:phage holin family protein [Gemella cuniculi]